MTCLDIPLVQITKGTTATPNLSREAEAILRPSPGRALQITDTTRAMQIHQNMQPENPPIPSDAACKKTKKAEETTSKRENYGH
jgi:hypothetical protein